MDKTAKLNERILIAQVIMLVFGIVLIGINLFLGLRSPLGFLDEPLGRDFYAFWSAGRLAIEGKTLIIYDSQILANFQRNFLGIEGNFGIPWFYPPLFLLWISQIFALFPYKIAYFIYLILSVSIFIFTSRRFFPKLSLIAIVGFPAFWINLLAGQNGLLTAFFLISGCLFLEKSPKISGVSFAFMSFKPHFCLIIPVYLLQNRSFKVILSGVVTLSLLIIFSILLYGKDIWFVFFDSLFLAQNYNQLAGEMKTESFAHLYGALRSIGLSHKVSFALNYVFVAINLGLAFKIWRSNSDNYEKYAALILLTLLAAPHLLYYDLVVTGAVILWLWPRVQLRPALMLLWLTPLIGPFFAKYGLSLFPIVTLYILFILNFSAIKK